jgi:hypothetical protein
LGAATHMQCLQSGRKPGEQRTPADNVDLAKCVPLKDNPQDLTYSVMGQVRCDGRHNVCRNCERLRFDCSFRRYKNPGAAHDASTVEDFQTIPERRRGVRACTECRAQKTRCSGEFPDCGNCSRRSRQCIYPVPKRPTRSMHAARASGARQGESNLQPFGAHHRQWARGF